MNSILYNKIKGLALVLAAFFMFSSAFAQDKSGRASTSEEPPIQKLIEAKNFQFVAQQISPMRGPTRHLTSFYDVVVSPDSLRSELPYFGRAYTAPVYPHQGGIVFVSEKYDYNVKARRKGGWEVLIQPKDVRDVQQMQLTVFNNGTATLHVTSTNRQAIVFRGYVKERS